MRNHVKLEIRSFVMNFNSRGFSLRILYCVVDTGYGLGRSLGNCIPAVPEGRKYQMVKHKLRATIDGQYFEQTHGRSSEFHFPLRFAKGRLEFVTQAFGGSPKLSSSGLAISMTNLIVQNL